MPFFGEIKIFAGPTAPPGFIPCDGYPTSGVLPILAIDGAFVLPDLRSRTPVHGPLVPDGRLPGFEEVSLSLIHLPSHFHEAGCSAGLGSSHDPEDNLLAGTVSGSPIYGMDPSPNASFDPSAVKATGEGESHSNIQPYLALNFCICVSGGSVPH